MTSALHLSVPPAHFSSAPSKATTAGTRASTDSTGIVSCMEGGAAATADASGSTSRSLERRPHPSELWGSAHDKASADVRGTGSAGARTLAVVSPAEATLNDASVSRGRCLLAAQEGQNQSPSGTRPIAASDGEQAICQALEQPAPSQSTRGSESVLASPQCLQLSSCIRLTGRRDAATSRTAARHDETPLLAIRSRPVTVGSPPSGTTTGPRRNAPRQGGHTQLGQTGKPCLIRPRSSGRQSG